MNSIVSSSPGRIRLRDKGLRDRGKLDRLKQNLTDIAAIESLQGNARTGSLLVRFDPNATETAAMEEKLNAAAASVLGKPSVPQGLLSKKAVNRYNKIAMLASLGSSLALLIKRRKRWRRLHALTGYVFVANLGVHLYIYRKSLLRLFQ